MGPTVLPSGDSATNFSSFSYFLFQGLNQDVIATAQLMGYCPETMVLIGCQPEELEDYGGGLRDIVAAQIDPAIKVALGILDDWGVAHSEGKADQSLLADASILRSAYEDGRPSEEEACRTGDDRFFPESA